jgi:hypothetical protein
LADSIGIIRCCRAFDRQGDVFLCFKLCGVNGLGIQVKCCGHPGVAQQSLNRFYFFAEPDWKVSADRRIRGIGKSNSRLTGIPEVIPNLGGIGPENDIRTWEVWFWRLARLRPILVGSWLTLTLQSRGYSDH